MVKKLFVGSLSYSAGDDELNEAFSAFGGVVSAQVIKERDTGRSRGFGFVEMETDEQAENAMKEMDGKDLMGRQIVVNLSKEKPRGSFQRR